MLNTDAFVERAVRAHRSLFWNNVSNVLLLEVRSRLRTSGGLHYVAGARSVLYRGANSVCLDQPAEMVNGQISTTTNEDGVSQEGVVEVHPFWAPETTVKVCAFDAQEASFSPSGTDCSSEAGTLDPGCGCGPQLIWCGTNDTRTAVREAMGEDLDHRIRNLIQEDRPYTELFTHAFAYMNGPLVHYWKYWARLSNGINNTPIPISPGFLPELDFSETDNWVKVDLDPAHAGALTSPAFLLRFQTDRGRASQFFTQFLCAPFQAPNGPLPVDDSEAQMQPDLQKRAGCKYCHAVLEPAAAHWGRWAQQGAAHLDVDGFPAMDFNCLSCALTGSACSSECARFYTVTTLDPAEEEYLGMLTAYLFLRDEHKPNVEHGPKLLALKSFADNRLTACSARTLAERLIGRPLQTDEDEWLDELVLAFATSGYSYKALFKAVVTSPIYRRVR